MYGDFVVDKGSYNFKWSLIDKTFQVKTNSIVWDGDPYRKYFRSSAL
jgi:hypothetical protein